MRFGSLARDKVTGLVGIVGGAAQHLRGQRLVYVSPGLNNAGELRRGRWIDAKNVEALDDKPKARRRRRARAKVKPAAKAKTKTKTKAAR